MIQTHGTTSLYELFGDFVVLRNLAPVDPRIPSLAEAWQAIGLAGPAAPRKMDPAYAQVCLWFLQQGQALQSPGVPLRELLFIGDTAMNDGNAYRSLRRAGDWPGWAFIGNEKPGQPPSHVIEESNVYVANRWTALADWLAWAIGQGARCDRGTAVVVDMDKTAVGARGRNDAVIDNARVQAVHHTVAGLLSAPQDQARFQAAYDELKEQIYHPFTADNQDYLTYICLIVGAGLIDLPVLLEDIRAGRMASFRQFIDWADGQMATARPDLRQIHQDVYSLVQAGDATPFKAFRRNEFLFTAARFGCLPLDAPLEQMLAEQICITQEVREVVLWLKARGCLLFTMSDKPDEATLATPEQEAQGYRSLHRLETTAVGESIAAQLANLAAPVHQDSPA